MTWAFINAVYTVARDGDLRQLQSTASNTIEDRFSFGHALHCKTRPCATPFSSTAIRAGRRWDEYSSAAIGAAIKRLPDKPLCGNAGFPPRGLGRHLDRPFIKYYLVIKSTAGLSANAESLGG